MIAKARSTPNIALIKYWGNRNNTLRLPAADSLSITIDKPTVEATVEQADVMEIESFTAEGQKRELKASDLNRYDAFLTLVKEYLEELGLQSAIPSSLKITIASFIPPSVGLASSAAVFSCVAKAISGLVEQGLTDEQVSIIARLGSGSASRSIFGGFAALANGDGDGHGHAHAVQIAPEEHWKLHDIVIVPSHQEKKVGSTDGHALAHTSPSFKHRVEDITNRRQKECIDAILGKDFEKLQRVTEEDCIDMHYVMETSNPPLYYLSKDTHRIVSDICKLREEQHIPVLYTMDAGPTVHLITTDEGLEAVQAFAHSQEGCTIFETTIGKGAQLLPTS